MKFTEILENVASYEDVSVATEAVVIVGAALIGVGEQAVVKTRKRGGR